ncbi:NADH-quinone oxidoreductase subunit A [candidate division KSB1 bacterium]
MIYNFLNVFLFLVVGIVVVSLTIVLSRIIHPRNITDEKLTTYECGEDPVGDSWIRFNNRFYIIALIFIIFDIEVVFLFPWAIVFKRLGMFAFIEMMVFIAILMVGFAYVWAKGDLEWVKSYFTEQDEEVLQTPND